MTALCSLAMFFGSPDAIVSQLGHDVWQVREAATANLNRMGFIAYPALHSAMESKCPETARRASTIARKIHNRWIAGVMSRLEPMPWMDCIAWHAETNSWNYHPDCDEPGDVQAEWAARRELSWSYISFAIDEAGSPGQRSPWIENRNATRHYLRDLLASGVPEIFVRALWCELWRLEAASWEKNHYGADCLPPGKSPVALKVRP